MIRPADITRAARRLFPHVDPLRTRRDLSGNGMLISYTLTMPEPAARHWGATSLATAVRAGEYLTRELGTPVHVADVYATRRTPGGKLVHIVIKTGGT